MARAAEGKASDGGPAFLVSQGGARKKQLDPSPRYLIAAGLITAATGGILFWMGRAPICQCGAVKLWHGIVQSPENSQHVADWYSFSHVVHGFIFYGGIWLLSRLARWPLSLGAGLVLATALEAGWEITENTDVIINRYREATIALDYFGDSVVNSTSDILMMMIGFLIASRLPPLATLAIAAVLELGVAYVIRDNLILNVIMLLYPLDAIRVWQSGA
jgi:hypothetical protein